MEAIGFGAYPDFMVRSLMEGNHIRGVLGEYINPASIDLPITGNVWQLTSSALPRKGEPVSGMLQRLQATQIGNNECRTLYNPRTSYVLETSAEFDLPPGVYAHFNPKSSSGRDAWVIRALVDGIDIFDALPMGCHGSRRVYLSATPTKMPILMSPGETLAQARVFSFDTRLNIQQFAILYELGARLLFKNGKPLPWNRVRKFESEGSLGISLDLRKRRIIGWRCRENRRIVDYSKIQDIRLFFEPVYADESGCLMLEEGFFYILSTDEEVLVPPNMACEVLPIKDWLGDVRIHAAGYIDPGWGCGIDGNGRGRRITLEVWPHENLLVQPNQVVGLLRYEQMVAAPHRHYDQISTSHYRTQEGARPSKRFA